MFPTTSPGYGASGVGKILWPGGFQFFEVGAVNCKALQIERTSSQSSSSYHPHLTKRMQGRHHESPSTLQHWPCPMKQAHYPRATLSSRILIANTLFLGFDDIFCFDRVNSKAGMTKEPNSFTNWTESNPRFCLVPKSPPCSSTKGELPN